MESNPVLARRARPVAPYVGGKRNLSGRICPMIDATPHITYAEVFGGMLGVFLRRSLQSKAEVINDISRDVTTFFRILQRHYPQLMDTLKFQITTRAEFERLSAVDPDTLTDLERAARFLYLQRTTFGGKVAGRTFGVAKERPGRFDVTTLGPMLEDLHERLAGVVIERLGYAEFIRRYDSPGTLFYLDPPYWGCERDYGDSVFERADFERLADQLSTIEGRFILSINDTPGAREVFGRFSLEEAETSYTVSATVAKRAGELIVIGGAGV